MDDGGEIGMRWFKDMKIGTKLVSTFIIVACMAAFLGGFGILNLKNADEKYTALYEDYGISLGELGKAGIDFNRNRYRLANILLTGDQAKK
jgi:methyl-accepting chemotaxis protein